MQVTRWKLAEKKTYNAKLTSRIIYYINIFVYKYVSKLECLVLTCVNKWKENKYLTDVF